jgi:large subunit ribosomal protein L22
VFMQVTAQLNNLRISPRKVRLVAKVIKGMDANVAKYQLDHVVKKSSMPISKLLSSAISNARSNFNLAKDNLFIKDIIVNEGPKLKRFRPKGFGMASPIEKKTSHIRIILEEKIPGLKPSQETTVEKREQLLQPENEVAGQEVKETKTEKQTARPEIKKELGQKGGLFGRVSGLGKKFFRRKVV